MPPARHPQSLYHDRWIECAPEHLLIRGYYFPFGPAKAIAYSKIRSVERFPLTTWTGKWRIWGTTSPRYWTHLDPQRPRKTVGLLLHLDGFVRPWITPDDPDAVEQIIRRRLLSPEAP
ncbi:MAG: hypothetical protein JW785_06625 [Acidimicrobiia bacterium]|nr:hypothetical protein [Acidimicrobiia bacterium]